MHYYDVIVTLDDNADPRRLQGAESSPQSVMSFPNRVVPTEELGLGGFEDAKADPNSDLSAIPGQVLNEKTFRTSSLARTATYEVFPRHDSYRTDKQGDFALCRSTRDAIGKFHRKLYCTPRYGLMYPEQSSDSCPLPETTPLYDVCGVKRVRFADDQGYNLETRPPPRDDWEQIANMAKWPKLGGDDGTSVNNSYENRQIFLLGSPDQDQKAEDSKDTKHEANKKEMDVNQNFHDLIPSIYNYKLPAALHQSDVPFSQDEVHEVPMVHESVSIRTFPRPTFPVSLLAKIRDATEEISLMNQEVRPIPTTIPPGCTSDLPNYVDQWSNSSVLEKQKLSNKTCSQRRYHMDHPEVLPDLRDHVTYSKRVFFDGFNSSAYRG
ncbi:hypothetical protein FSP39_000603 [Pinctada imbricata]|uniref:Uncharacterized protein n=1 Tax=Pinctada imbricata TaxID=66713 RepID=A0AA88YGM0_PINIB|nr:hypothetical protein FSP39_000603 [Pinctada imbricata]